MADIRDRVKEFRRVKASDLKPNPKNWRRHPESQQAAIRTMLEEVGFAGACLARELSDGSLELIDGHLRSGEVGDATIPVLILDVDETEADKLLATFDPISAMADADAAQLKALLSTIEAGDDLASLLKTIEDQHPITIPAGEVSEDEVPELPKKPITNPGDLWIMGSHRLLCGDSTKAEDVARLMGGRVAAVVNADPPYGIDFQSNMRTKTERFKKLANDDKILDGWISPTIANSNGWVFVWSTWKVLGEWMFALKPFGDLSNMVVWFKGGGGMGDLRRTFSTDYEVAFVFNRGAELKGKRIGSVWEIGKDHVANYLHPTQKPVALGAMILESATVPGDTAFDPFLGSGSMLIACEQTGRKCCGLELETGFCDVIVKRWENLTGKKATLEKPKRSKVKS